MGLILQVVYSYIFNFFCLPVFVLMLIGRPKFLVRAVHQILQFQEPIKKLKIFRIILYLCITVVVYSYYRKWAIEKLVHELAHSGDALHGSVHFIDEKLREAHLFERNSYMFFAFSLLIIIVEKFCHSYFKLWELKEQLEVQRLNLAKVQPAKEPVGNVVKDPLLKKTE